MALSTCHSHGGATRRREKRSRLALGSVAEAKKWISIPDAAISIPGHSIPTPDRHHFYSWPAGVEIQGWISIPGCPGVEIGEPGVEIGSPGVGIGGSGVGTRGPGVGIPE